MSLTIVFPPFPLFDTIIIHYACLLYTSAGGDSAKEAFQQTISALAGMEDPLAQNTAGVDLFGTMWEDLGPEAVTALADIQEGAYDTGDAMGQIKDIKYDDLGSQFEERCV